MRKINELDFLLIGTERDSSIKINEINNNKSNNFIVEELNHDTFYSLRDSIDLDSLAMLVVTDGSIVLTNENEKTSVGPNSVVRVIPEHLTELTEISNDFKGKLISINKNLLSLPTTSFSPNTYLYVRQAPVLELGVEEIDEVLELFYLIKKKVRKIKSTSDEKVFHCLIMALFFELNGSINRQIEQRTPITLSHKENLYRKFLILLRENIKKEHSVTFYASQLCLTPQYISSVLKELSGMTANKWIDEMLLAEAKLLLFSTENNIQEIADQLCFPDQSSFGKFFKKMTGMSPTNYRKQKI